MPGYARPRRQFFFSDLLFVSPPSIQSNTVGEALEEIVENKAPVDSPVFSGVVVADNYDVSILTLSSNTINVDFGSGEGIYQRNADGNIVFTGSNYKAGSLKTIKISSDASSRNLTFPSQWIFVGVKPTAIDANKTGILALACFGTTESQCVASWTAEL